MPLARRTARTRSAVAGAVAAALVLLGTTGTASAADEPGTVSGRVLLPAGVDPARVVDVSIWVDPVGSTGSFRTAPSPDGRYTVDVGQPSTLRFAGPADLGLVTEYYGGAHAVGRATVVQPGPERTGFDVQLDVGGTLSGRLTAPAGHPADSWYVRAQNLDDATAGTYETPVAADGAYTLRALPTGRFRVAYLGPGVEYWKDSETPEGATPVAVTLGRATTGIDPQVGVTTGVTEATAPAVVPVGTPVPVRVRVWARDGRNPPGDVLVLAADGRELGRAPLVDGAAEVAATGLPAGRHVLTARYPGSGEYEPSERTLAVDVAAPAALAVARVDPAAGAVHPVPFHGGSWVTVEGTGFADGAELLLGDQAVPAEVVSSTRLRAYVWRRTAGSVPVRVRSGGATSPQVPQARYTWTSALGVPPSRLLDAADPGTRCVDVRGRAGVPSDATGVWLNVTTVGPAGPGYVVVHPGADGPPAPVSGSTVNFEPGRDVANAAYVAVPPGGTVCYTAVGARVRVLLDVTGYTVAGSGVTATTSTRLLDTRPGGVGEVDGPVRPRTLHTVQVAGRAGVPADATSVLLNVTVTGATAPGNLRVLPGGQDVPSTSVVNYAPGVDKANATTVALVDGAVSFWSDTAASTAASPVQVLLDVVGWTTGGSPLRTVAPTRVLDTRPASRVGALDGPLPPRTDRTFSVTAGGAVPADATAVVLTVTAVGPSGPGNLRVFPEPGADAAGGPPGASVLNYVVGRDVPNQVVLPLTGSGRVTLHSDTTGGPVHVAVDVVGYVGAP